MKAMPLLPLLSMFVSLASLAAATPAQPRLMATDAWSRPSTGAAGAGFLAITNLSRAGDELVSANSPVATRVEFHATTLSGGLAAMQKLSSVPFAPGETVVFKPGGRHLMLMGLKRPLAAGERFPVTLTFASGGRVTAIFTVGVAGPPKAAHPHH